MISQKLTVLDLTDIEYANIVCPREDCKARISMRLGLRKSVPDKCPVCKKEFDKDLRARLADL